MSAFEMTCDRLREEPLVWTVTGAAGFIGSHLVEHLLRLGQTVRALDNFSTGKRANLAELETLLSPEQWSRFTLIEGDLRDPGACGVACVGADRILHQAARGSVPRSIEDPVATHEDNINGTLNLLAAMTDRPEALDRVFNVAMQERTTLNELHAKLKSLLDARGDVPEIGPPVRRDFRPGDIRHSLADISKARDLLGYEPTHDIDRGLGESIEWYCRNLR